MSKPREVLGKRFGLMVAVQELPKTDGMRTWQLKCDCGSDVVTLQKNFIYGDKISCGCAIRPWVAHGMHKTREYKLWSNIRSRCNNPNTPYWATYGGRGIRVCDRWQSSFLDFLADVGPRPTPRHTLDRIDVNGDYEPGNCRWATYKEQMRNTRVNKIVEVDGRQITLAEAVDSAPVGYNTVLYRLKRGWTVEDAVTRPQQRGVRP